MRNTLVRGLQALVSIVLGACVLLLCVSMGIPSGLVSESRAQAGTVHPDALPPGANEAFDLVTLEVIGMTPASVVAGTPVTIFYRLHASTALPKEVTGSVEGTFQGVKLVSITPANVIVQPAGDLNGQLQIKMPTAGTGALQLAFYGALSCSGTLSGGLVPCHRPTYATVSKQITVAVPIVHVRIPGQSFMHLSTPDPNDSTWTEGGYQCVVHDPGCGFLFTHGNDGTDTFFDVKPLPSGAVLEEVDFTQFWPNDLNSADASGSGGGSGSYGARLQQGSDVSVAWNNACWWAFGGRKLYYSISFVIAMPQGTDIGDTPANGPPPSTTPCLPSGYSAVPVSTSQSFNSTTFYLPSQGTWFGANFGGGSSGGSITSITNGENFEISLLSDKNISGGCQGTGNLILAAHGSASSAQLNDLYGQNLKYPRVVGACAPTAITETRQSIQLIIQTSSP